MKSKIFIAIMALIIIGIAVSVIIRSKDTHKINNVILITLDTTRADYLSCYGYLGRTTPNIDAVAAEGVLFENVVSPVPLTLPAHSSILTGTIPPYHTVRDNFDYRLSESNITLAEILKEAGFRTGAVISAFVLDSKFGISQGFDYYNDQFEKKHPTVEINERKGHETSRFAIEWLEKNKDERFFLFLHYYDPHHDYRPPEPFASRFAQNPYAGEIAYTDYCIGRVIQKLKDLKLYDSTLLIITADHGEMLNEHGEPSHGYFIYESAIKVPLIFKLPGQNQPVRIKSIAALVDIVPTICSLLNIKQPENIHGIDLSAGFKGGKSSSSDRHIYCESVVPTKYNANSLLAVVTDRYKYIQTTRPELYDLVKDSREQNNLVKQEPQRTRILKDKLQQILEKSVRTEQQGSKIELNAAARKKLESLGYIGASVHGNLEFDQTKADPKDTVSLYVDEQEVILLKTQGKFDQARDLCEKLLAQHPYFLIGHRHLAEIAIGRGDFILAANHFSKLLELDPNDPHVYNDRGFSYRQVRKYDLAIRDFNQAIKLNSTNADFYNNRALAYVRKNDYGRAIDDFSQAIKLNPTDAEFYDSRALAYRAQGRYDLAIQDFSQAIKLSPANPAFHYNMGLTLEMQGRTKEAVRYYRQTLRLRGNWPDVLNNLAWILTTHKDAEVRNESEALRLAQRACELTNYKIPSFLDTLATAFAANGQFDMAIENAAKGLEICRKRNIIPLAEEIQKRLNLFKQHKTYSE